MTKEYSITLGPLKFTFEPDGDDPGTGWIKIEHTINFDSDRIQATPSDWEWFMEAAG